MFMMRLLVPEYRYVGILVDPVVSARDRMVVCFSCHVKAITRFIRLYEKIIHALLQALKLFYTTLSSVGLVKYDYCVLKFAIFCKGDRERERERESILHEWSFHDF